MSSEPTPNERLVLETLRQLAEDLSLEDVESLADDLIEELPQFCQEIKNAILSENAEETHRFAHSLNGTANIFGLQTLIELCQTIENAARDQQLDQCKPLLPLLEETGPNSIKTLQNALNQLRSSA